jgi:phosphate transport system substrate-binding protein
MPHYSKLLALIVVILPLTADIMKADIKQKQPKSKISVFVSLQGSLDISGGTAHIPVMQEAAQKILATNNKIRINVAGGGSGVGVRQVGEGLVDIGNTGRPLSAKEMDHYKLKSIPFAIDGIAIVVHPTNKLDNLSSEDAKKIFLGQQNLWNNGPVGKIHMYIRDEASGTRETFADKLLGSNTQAPSAHVVVSNGAMKQAIAHDPLAIGYISIGHLDASVKALKLDGIAATQENTINGKYAIARKLYMNTRQKPSPLTAAFIDFVTSVEMEEGIRKFGYIPYKTI